MDSLVLREIRQSDCAPISQAFTMQGWNKPVSQYENYVQMQFRKERNIILAECQGQFAGYLTIRWESSYPPFQEKGIPDIVDFNVLKKFQRKGIGNSLMEEAEGRIKKVSDYCGIGFGLDADYGAAQILYIKRGYIPDGNGLVYQDKAVQYGQKIIVNEALVFHLIKSL